MRIIKWSSKKIGTHEILLDDEDFEKFGRYIWTVEKPTNGSTFYAKRKYTYALNERKSVALHREILGITDPTIFIDHIDGNGLNNQKTNLRVARHEQNTRNRGKQKNNTTGYKGVFKIKNTNSYKTVICIRENGKRRVVFQKQFLSAFEAAKAYNQAAIIHHGEFAYQNPV